MMVALSVQRFNGRRVHSTFPATVFGLQPGMTIDAVSKGPPLGPPLALVFGFEGYVETLHFLRNLFR